ncbi:MAG: sigma-E processing peptidase SpoIIGA [Bacilli bacterium]|nr:sigma-E processing peptidase SpoIIGA [Bacilli bacterium]
MKVYLDYIFLINYIFDFIILLSTSLILKRNIKFYRILFGALIGSITILELFIPMNKLELIMYKFFISILMIIFTFNFNNIRYFFKNLYYMYLISIILGGFITFINNNFNKLNIFIYILLSITLIYIYIKNIKELKTNYNKYYKVDIYYDNKIIKLNAFLDTGNKLIDPYKKWPVILVKEKYIKCDKYLYIPFNTISSKGLLKCIKIDKIYIENIGYRKKLFVGLTNNINIDGIDCILNEKLMEG